MINPVIAQVAGAQPSVPGPAALAPAPDGKAASVALKFEQMLWAEMLTHAGLEKAFTQNGGEGASAFSRYIIEAISSDIAEKHPLGLARIEPLNTPELEDS